MASPDRLIRLYQSSQPASFLEIKRALYGPPVSEPKPPHRTDPEPSPRETANGSLGGRRAERIRNGDDGRSRGESRKRTRTTGRPRMGIVFSYSGEGIREYDILASTGTEGRTLEHCRRGIPHKNRGGISPQAHGRK